MRQDLLLLPGLLCDDALWAHQRTGLADVARPVVADLTRDETVDDMARRALDLMEGPFALAGLSMGGYVALALMRLAPTRVTRLCLMDTSARADSAEQARRRRGLIALSRAHKFRGVTPRLLPSLVHPARLTDAGLTGAVMDMAARVGADAFIRQQHAILSRPDSRADLQAIGAPTLVVVGSDDQLTPPELSHEIAAMIPGAVLRVVADAGHLPPLERPAAVTVLMREWLAAPPALPLTAPG